MLPGWVIVLDIGKTLAKLSLWDEHGRMLAQRVLVNQPLHAHGWRVLNAPAIEDWMAGGLAEFARMGPVSAIVPVAHGAAAALIGGGRLIDPVQDYEEPLPVELMASYRGGRDAFALTGSPCLPDGLNLGAQLHRLEADRPGIFGGDAQLLPWAQYWAWRLSGVAASEVTSLGCHTDLWQPAAGTPSKLAQRRGWAAHLAPLRRADEVLGTITAEWAGRTGLDPGVLVYCGLHDSNAALFAARGFPQLDGQEATVVSTGTWFVAMRSPAPGAAMDLSALPESRDCLVNVDVHGRPVPSARFMGGREIEALGGFGAADDAAALAQVPPLCASASMVLPCWTPGVGPFPRSRGGWIGEPAEPAARRAALGLYLALMTDASLDLIGSRERILVEGRFAESEVFVRALASLRPDATVYVCGAYEGVPCGALRLVNPELAPPRMLRRIEPLDVDLADYRTQWHCHGVAEEHA